MVIKELRTGYRRLHKYGHNKDQQLTTLCKCGEEETNKQYLDKSQILSRRTKTGRSTKYKPVMQKLIRGNYPSISKSLERFSSGRERHHEYRVLPLYIYQLLVALNKLKIMTEVPCKIWVILLTTISRKFRSETWDCIFQNCI